jgi:hypothetical protein
MSASDAAVRAIARLRNARDEVDLVLRAPGELLTISRHAADAILDDLGVVARLIREMAERYDA